jgi:hypothetical protein
MRLGLRLPTNGSYVYFDPDKIVSDGHAPVVIVVGHFAQVQEYFNGLPNQVRYRDGTQAVPIVSIFIGDSATLDEAVFMCRQSQSSHCMVVVGLTAIDSRAHKAVERFARATILV